MSGTIVAIGTFDGVHLGHQKVLSQVQDIAKRKGATSIAYAFSSLPRQTKPSLLLPRSGRLLLLRHYVDEVEIAVLDEVRTMLPRDFCEQVLVNKLDCQVVVVGENFRFGNRRVGDLSTLRKISQDYDFSVIGVRSTYLEGELVSSTKIRNLLGEGKIPRAGSLLGRPPLLMANVVSGDRLGRKLGYPTANLELDPDLLVPKSGVYLARAFWPNGKGVGLLYIGRRPTISGKDDRCELHLLSTPSIDLYDQELEVHLLERIRMDSAFPTVEDLSRQISLDIERAHLLLPKAPTTTPMLV